MHAYSEETISLINFRETVYRESTLYPLVVWPDYKSPTRGLKTNTLPTCVSLVRLQ